MSFGRPKKKKKLEPRHGEFPFVRPSPMMRHAGKTAIPEPVRMQMEGALNTDFSDVTITHNSAKARQMDALAYTYGNQIHFAPGMDNLHSGFGQHVLKHELAHVRQQRRGGINATGRVNGLAVNEEPALESEAHRMASGASSASSYSQAGGNSNNPVAQCFKFKYPYRGSKRAKPAGLVGSDIEMNLMDEDAIYTFLANVGDEKSEKFENARDAAIKGNDPDEIEWWNTAVKELGIKGGKIVIAKPKGDPAVFTDIENRAVAMGYPNLPSHKHRHALDFIDYVITQKNKVAAQDLHTLLFGDRPKQESLTGVVRPGGKHEHLMTSLVVKRLLDDLQDTFVGGNKQALSYHNVGKYDYSAWHLLNDTLSHTWQIVLNRTTTREGNKKTQDHHVTENGKITYFAPSDPKTPKQATGEGSGTGQYHNELKTEANKFFRKPIDLANDLRKVNNRWLAKKSDITAVKAADRANQQYNIGGAMKRFDNPADLNAIGTEIENQRNDVLGEFDKVIKDVS